MPEPSELSVVQRPLIDYATQVGWKYVKPSEALRLRRGETGILLHDLFCDQLVKLNPGIVDQDRAERVVRELTTVRPNIEGNLDAWEFLRGLKTVFVEEEKRERNLRLLDPEPAANVFHVTEELRFTSGTRTVRADVVFFVNGIPVIVLEAKAATRTGGIPDALDQLRRYHLEAPELLAVVQLQALTQLVHFYYGATWNSSAKSLLNWKDESGSGFENLVKSFVSPNRVLRVIADFILFTRADGELNKVLLRPHQMRAVDRVLARARDGSKRRGLVWHTQGSGKTYSMITAAKKIMADETLANPTVLMLVDRNELEAQLFVNLEAVGIDNVVVADSKRHLRDLLATDRRGLLVSMIHKFDGIPADINTRNNLFVLVDEAHRTTGGDLGNYLMGALPNATYVGFTGTPIDRSAHGKGTFKVFGADDPDRQYLDKYSIRESIADGATVPLHYALAPNELRIDRDVLDEEFLDLKESEGVSDFEELNRVLEKAVTLKNMLKNEARVSRVARFVARHFKEAVEPLGYKAFLVAVDREACVLYKEALDHHLAAHESAVVMSAGHNDSPELVRHHLSDERERQVRKDFRDSVKDPKILIVTEKLLTGFDAPVLYAMYLDKPMRDHVLLQAIARVNRPYEDEGRRKPAGFVLDFVGIFEKLEKALAFDSADVEGVILDLEVLKKHFVELMTKAREHLEVGTGLPDDKRTDALLERYGDQGERDRFYTFFRELEETYEVLSPDPFLRPYLEDYMRLAWNYWALRAAEAPGPGSRDFYRKTERLVQDHARSGVISEPEEIYELGEGALERIASSNAPDRVKVFNLLKLIDGKVRAEADHSPHLVPIGERAQAIVEAFQQRQTTTQEALEQLKLALEELEEVEREGRDAGLSREALAGFYLLQEDGADRALEIATAMGEAMDAYPYWRESEDQERHLRRSLYLTLSGAAPDHMPIVDRMLDLLKRGAK